TEMPNCTGAGRPSNSSGCATSISTSAVAPCTSSGTTTAATAAYSALGDQPTVTCLGAAWSGMPWMLAMCVPLRRVRPAGAGRLGLLVGELDADPLGDGLQQQAKLCDV